MASLKELVEQASRMPLDTLRQLEGHEAKARSDTEAAQLRIVAGEKELVFTRPVREALRDRVEALKGNVAALEKQLDEQRGQLQRAGQEYQEKTEQASRLRKDRSLAEAASQEAERWLRDVQEQKRRAELALKNAHRSALRRYLETTGNRLAQFVEMQDKKRAGVEALERLMVERNRDPLVATLCEAREELKRILPDTRVPTVIAAIKAQLDDVERKIEAIFPGALLAESQTTGEELEEIFYVHLPDRKLRLYLPLTDAVWDGLRSGKSGALENMAVRLVWSMLKSLEADWDGSVALLLKDLGVVLDVPGKFDLSDRNVTMPVGESGSVTFMFNPLPSTVEGALYEDNSAPRSSS